MNEPSINQINFLFNLTRRQQFKNIFTLPGKKKTDKKLY